MIVARESGNARQVEIEAGRQSVKRRRVVPLNIRTDEAATALFGNDRRAGFMTNDRYILAVKCKRVHMATGGTGEACSLGILMPWENNTNTFDGKYLHAFSDGKAHTLECFARSIKADYPARIALHVDGDYMDYGWGRPERIDDEGKLVFLLDDATQKRFEVLPYPSIPLDTPRPSVRTMFENFVYDSKLEATVAALFRELGWNFAPQPRPFATAFGDWRTDFRVDTLNASPGDATTTPQVPRYYIEVKPTFPLLSEMQRCEAAAYQVPNVPFVLLFGPVRLPYVNITDASSQSSYDRLSPGLLGMMWSVETVTNASGVSRRAVTCTSNVCLCERDGVVDFCKIDSFTADYSWCTPRLVSCYNNARARVQQNQQKHENCEDVQ